MAIIKRDEFINQTQGWLGVIKLDKSMTERAVGVEPFGHILLSEDEQELTAQSQARPESNPFLETDIVHYDLKTGDEVKRFRGPKLLRIESTRPTGAAQAPVEAAPEGSSDDEVGVPDAPTYPYVTG